MASSGSICNRGGWIRVGLVRRSAPSSIFRRSAQHRGSSAVAPLAARPSRWHGASIVNTDRRQSFGCADARRNCFRSFGASRSGRGSPYVVLQVRTNASKDEIKAAFRKLAKRHHPDLRGDGGADDNIMAELIAAYETLMNKHNHHLWIDGRDSRVSLACEMYTIEELRSMHQVFDVYSFRVMFNGTLADEHRTIQHDATNVRSGEQKNLETMSTLGMSNGNFHHLDPAPVIPLEAHPDDSVSDLKRHIQSQYAVSWGLDGRRKDRDGLHLGWELVYCGNLPDNVVSAAKDSMDGGRDICVLSYHLFLHSYGILDGDLLHAIVRRRNEP